MKTVLRITISLLFLIALGLFVSKTIDLHKVAFQLSYFPKDIIILLCCISILISILKSWRFFILIKNNNIHPTFWQTLKVYIAGQATTPLPAGEAMRGILLKHEVGTSFTKTTGPVITQAFLELFSASLVVLLGSAILDIFRISAIVSFVLILFLTALLLNKKLLTTLLKLTRKIEAIYKKKKKLVSIQKAIQKNILSKEKRFVNTTFLITLGIGVCTNLLGGLMIFLIAYNLGVPLDMFRGIFLYACNVVIMAFAGIIPGGLGFTEGGMTGILLLYQVPITKAITIVLLFRLITLGFYILIGILFILAFYSKPLLIDKSYEKN